MDGGAWWATVHGVAKSRTRLSDFTFTFHFHALEKEMATHSSVLASRIPGTGHPGGLPSMDGVAQSRTRLKWLSSKTVKADLQMVTASRVKNWSEVAQSCLTLCDPMDSSPPGSTIHGIFQARILEWAAISFSRGSSQPRDGTCVSCITDTLPSEPPEKPRG